MKAVMILLTVILVLLQYRLWFTHDGLPAVLYLHRQFEIQRQDNNVLEERNKMLAADVHDLKSGLDALEERARNDMGMIKSGETFLHIIEESAGE
ncbi:MAG: cell division protein FtsB [Pseudomonadota bacterium]|nr:cell division protein FtsB [Pseudomonadota bacterium]MDO7711490.1 cell division protein FtsB [Pseudomonadota bacterium]